MLATHGLWDTAHLKLDVCSRVGNYLVWCGTLDVTAAATLLIGVGRADQISAEIVPHEVIASPASEVNQLRRNVEAILEFLEVQPSSTWSKPWPIGRRVLSQSSSDRSGLLAVDVLNQSHLSTQPSAFVRWIFEPAR